LKVNRSNFKKYFYQSILAYQGFVRANATEQEIINFIDEACDFTPETWQAECKIYVQQEVPVIIQLVEDNVPPEVICIKVGVCTNSTQVSIANQ